MTEEWSSLVNPGMPIPVEIQYLTGITPAMVANAPRFEHLADGLIGRLTGPGTVFVAHHGCGPMQISRSTWKTEPTPLA